MKRSRRSVLAAGAVLPAGLGFRALGIPSVLGVAAGSAWSSEGRAGDKTDSAIHVATNSYPWLTFARREGRDFVPHSDELLGKISGSGIVGYEPIINSASEFDGLGDRLKTHRLEMRSIYVNSVLHDDAKVDASIDSVMSIAKPAAKLGVQILVTNPSPIRWGGDEDKSDAQLRVQAESLDRLGRMLSEDGIILAYHNHDAELRQGGREFHHMLTSTNPEHVKFCLDAHWIYRGCGNSEVAVFDALSHYHRRIVELHLRQSRGGVWNEAFSVDGDIDYTRLFQFLSEKGTEPHYVLEQAVETESTQRLSDIAAHRQGRINLSDTIDG